MSSLRAFPLVVVLVASSLVAITSVAAGGVFNGQPDYQVDQYGYYYAVTGAKFAAPTTPNGDAASGGTFRYITDDPAWGPYTLDVWHKDGWWPQNGSLALTLKNGGGTVYDNNGLENGSFPANYYNYTAGYPNPGAGAVVAYSMSNDFDWIYAGYFKLDQQTTVTDLTGYFLRSTNTADITGGFDPNNPALAYHMNIFSNVAGDLLPLNTGSFAGDVFSSDRTAGSFAWSDTGYDRTGSASQQDIYRLTYALDNPITLQPGVYWFSSDASVVPEPASLVVWSVCGGIGAAGAMLRRRRARWSDENRTAIHQIIACGRQ